GAAGIRAPDHKPCGLHQLRKIWNLPTVNELCEEIVGEAGISAHLREASLRIIDGVGPIDIAFARAAWLPMSAPHRAHEIVAPDAIVRTAAQRQVERERNGAAKWVVRNVGVGPVGAIVRA